MKPSLAAYYRLLDVSPDCSSEDLKRAHRELVQVWHPDRFQSNQELQQKALDKLQEINSAYDGIIAFRTGRATGVESSQDNTTKTCKTEPGVPTPSTSPWVPLPIRIFLALGLGVFFIISLVLLSRIYVSSEQKGDSPSAVQDRRKSLEIRDETYLMRQRLVSRLQRKLDGFLLNKVGKQNYVMDIRIDVDAISKMILQISISIRLNRSGVRFIPNTPLDKKSMSSTCQKALLEELTLTIQRVARLVPARGDQVKITCARFN